MGLLGGSLAMASRHRRLADEICGYVRKPESAEVCRRRQCVDRVESNLEKAVRESELVILCTPVGQMRALAEAMLPALSRGTLITDVGSVKATLVSALESLFASSA